MKWIVKVSILVGIVAVFLKLLFKSNQERSRIQKECDKRSFYCQILNMWLEMKQKGKSAVTFLQEQGIEKVAIYGMKELGERFYEELKNTGIEVVCVIDKYPNQVIGDFVVISPEEEIPKVDAIVVTANYYYYEIEKYLKTKVDCPIYSINGVLGNSFRRNL